VCFSVGAPLAAPGHPDVIGVTILRSSHLMDINEHADFKSGFE
jgi:hypothetical protein